MTKHLVLSSLCDTACARWHIPPLCSASQFFELGFTRFYTHASQAISLAAARSGKHEVMFVIRGARTLDDAMRPATKRLSFFQFASAPRSHFRAPMHETRRRALLQPCVAPPVKGDFIQRSPAAERSPAFVCGAAWARVDRRLDHMRDAPAPRALKLSTRCNARVSREESCGQRITRRVSHVVSQCPGSGYTFTYAWMLFGTRDRGASTDPAGAGDVGVPAYVPRPSCRTH